MCLFAKLHLFLKNIIFNNLAVYLLKQLLHHMLKSFLVAKISYVLYVENDVPRCDTANILKHPNKIVLLKKSASDLN